jgi:hypothetical protein
MVDFQRTNAPRPTGPLDLLNDPGESFKNPTQLEFVRTLIATLKLALARMIYRDQATPYIHLQAPTGEVYRVEVDAAGVVRTVRAER